MRNSDPADKKKKPNRTSLLLFGIAAFVLITGAMIFNSLSECFWPLLFPPHWRVAFNQGVARAKVNRPEGIKMMEAALEECEKSSDSRNSKAKLFYDYGAWNFNEQGLPNRFATAKNAYSRCVAISDNRDRKAMALTMMANCDYYAGIAGDSERNAEDSWKFRQEDGNKDPAALWGTLEAMGRAAVMSEHYDKAQAAFKEAFEMAEKGKLWDGDGAAQSCGDLACAYALGGNRDLGDKTFFEAISRYDRASGACNMASERVIAAYARALKNAGDDESATKLAARLDNPDSLNDTGPFFKALSI